MVRKHHPTAARTGYEIVEARPRFDVYVFRAKRQRTSEDALSLFLGPLEVTAFPFRTARDDDRTAPAGQRAGGIWIAYRVESKLDQIGIGDRIAAMAELCHVRRGHGYTE